MEKLMLNLKATVGAFQKFVVESQGFADKIASISKMMAEWEEIPLSSCGCPLMNMAEFNNLEGGIDQICGMCGTMLNKIEPGKPKCEPGKCDYGDNAYCKKCGDDLFKGKETIEKKEPIKEKEPIKITADNWMEYWGKEVWNQMGNKTTLYGCKDLSFLVGYGFWTDLYTTDPTAYLKQQGDS